MRKMRAELMSFAFFVYAVSPLCRCYPFYILPFTSLSPSPFPLKLLFFYLVIAALPFKLPLFYYTIAALSPKLPLFYYAFANSLARYSLGPIYRPPYYLKSYR